MQTRSLPTRRLLLPLPLLRHRLLLLPRLLLPKLPPLRKLLLRLKEIRQKQERRDATFRVPSLFSFGGCRYRYRLVMLSYTCSYCLATFMWS